MLVIIIIKKNRTASATSWSSGDNLSCSARTLSLANVHWCIVKNLSDDADFSTRSCIFMNLVDEKTIKGVTYLALHQNIGIVAILFWNTILLHVDVKWHIAVYVTVTELSLHGDRVSTARFHVKCINTQYVRLHLVHHWTYSLQATPLSVYRIVPHLLVRHFSDCRKGIANTHNYNEVSVIFGYIANV